MILEGIQYVLGPLLIDFATITVGGFASLLSWSMVLDESRVAPAYRRPRGLIALSAAVGFDLMAWCPVLIANYMHLEDVHHYLLFISAAFLLCAFILVLIAFGLGVREANGARPVVIGGAVIITLATALGVFIMLS